MVASALGLDPLAHVRPDRGVLLRNKTGTDAGVRADAGLLGGLAYAVLARFDDARRDQVLEAMRAIGSAMQAVPTRSKPSRA
jgi:beta-lactamase class A